MGTSTNNQAVTNIIDSFSAVAKDNPGVLDFRWLPQASTDGAKPQPLRGVATYCPSNARRKEAAQKALTRMIKSGRLPRL